MGRIEDSIARAADFAGTFRAHRKTSAVLPVVSVGSFKSAGTSTLVMTIAAAAAAADIPVFVVDAAPDRDLSNWASRVGRPERIEVARCEKPANLKALVREGVDRRVLVVIDAGTRSETLRTAARLADTVLVPVRFSPLSAQAAAATDLFLSAETRSTSKRLAFVATAISQIPSRVARVIEAQLEARPTERLRIGLAQRAAFEAPFLYGGSIFTLNETQAPGLKRAREEAAALAAELDVFGSGTRLAARAAEAVFGDRQRRAA